MPRDPNIPDAFDVYTVVVLRRPADPPELSDEELDSLQSRHLAYRAGLGRGRDRRQRAVRRAERPVVSGDVDLRLRPAEAARLSDGDPSVGPGGSRPT